MWNSPIEIIVSEMESKLEEDVIKAVQSVGIRVDKGELLKALAYDREQYEKGYEDGRKSAESKIVKCYQCFYWVEGSRVFEGPNAGCEWCGKWRHYSPPFGFCNEGTTSGV